MSVIIVRLPTERMRLPILRYVSLYGIPGFAIHRHALLPDEFTVSHIETGVEVASGSTPVLALRAVREVMRREKRKASMRGLGRNVSGSDCLRMGIERARKRVA
jgi:hypothetical protein